MVYIPWIPQASFLTSSLTVSNGVAAKVQATRPMIRIRALDILFLLKLYGCDYLLNLNELIYLFINVLIKYDFHKEIIALSITQISWEYSSNLILLLHILNYSYEKAKKKYHCGLSLCGSFSSLIL